MERSTRRTLRPNASFSVARLITADPSHHAARCPLLRLGQNMLSQRSPSASVRATYGWPGWTRRTWLRTEQAPGTFVTGPLKITGRRWGRRYASPGSYLAIPTSRRPGSRRHTATTFRWRLMQTTPPYWRLAKARTTAGPGKL